MAGRRHPAPGARGPHAEPLSAPAPPWSQRIVDGACAVFAVWTVACQATVWLGGSLRAATLGAAALLGVLGAARLRLGSAAPPVGAEGEPWRPGRRDLGLAAGALAAAAAVGWLCAERPVAWWWAVLALLGLACAQVGRAAPRVGAPARGRSQELALWALAVACAVFVLVTHRADIDDAFYINLAAAAADAPGEPLLTGDTLHGIAGLPIHYPAYRVHSYEIWNGLLSWLTGIPVIACFHWVSAALAGLLAPLAAARLLRLLAPRRWLAAVFAWVLVLAVLGDTHQSYGNFAFVRLWQGKSIFLVVVLPLVLARAVEAALSPDARRWAWLAAAQAAAVGCTSSALWAAPAAALAAAASALPWTARGALRLGVLALASGYVLALALPLKSALDAEREAPTVAEAPLEEPAAPGQRLGEAMDLVLGTGPVRGVLLAALAAVWACCPPGLGRRFAAVVPLAVAAVLFDPYAAEWLRANATGPSYWRSFWALPLPILLALALSAPWAWAGRRAALGALLGVAACAAFASLPQRTTVAAANGTELGWPRLKVPAEPYAWARLLTERAPAGATVLAPGAVSIWLPTFPGRLHPLVVRAPYLVRYEAQLGREDVELRLRMTRAVGGEPPPLPAEIFAAGLDRFRVAAVCIATRADPALRAALAERGFERDLQTLEHEIWLREPPG